MKKRVLAVMLAACMIFSISPIAAYADTSGLFAEEDTTEAPVGVSGSDMSEIYVEGDSYVNPYIPNQAITEDKEELVGSDEDIDNANVDTIENFALTFKDYLLQRRNKFTINISARVSEEEWVEELNTFMDQLDTAIKEKAYEHTKASCEGDYLRFHVGSWNRDGFSLQPVSTGDGYYTVNLPCTYTVTYYSTLEQENILSEKLSGVIETLNLSNASDYVKVKSIHDFIVNNTDYDTEGANNSDSLLQYTAYAALLDKKAVCQGYANLFYRMCLAVGVDVRIVSGTGITSSTSGSHAWNIVKLGDKYYDIDVTWDDPISTVPQTEPSHEYFLIGHETFSSTHVRSDEYLTEEFNASYPMSEDNYNHTYLDEYPDNEPSFVKHSIALGSKIGVNFFMKLPTITGVDYSTAYMEFTVRGRGGKTTQSYNSGFRSTDGLLYGFSCDVSSIQMADTITAAFHYTENNTEKTVTEKYSVENYIKYYVDNYATDNTETLELVKALNDYGYYAQKFFERYNGDLVFGSSDDCDYILMDGAYTDSYSEERIGQVRSKIGKTNTAISNTGNIANVTYALNLESETSIYVYYEPEEGYTGSCDVFYQLPDNESTVDLDEVKLEDGRYRAIIPNITADLLPAYFNIWADTKGGRTINRVSAMTYIGAWLETDAEYQEITDLVMALYEYSEKTQNYINCHSQAS